MGLDAFLEFDNFSLLCQKSFFFSDSFERFKTFYILFNEQLINEILFSFFFLHRFYNQLLLSDLDGRHIHRLIGNKEIGSGLGLITHCSVISQIFFESFQTLGLHIKLFESIFGRGVFMLTDIFEAFLLLGSLRFTIVRSNRQHILNTIFKLIQGFLLILLVFFDESLY